MRRLQTAVSRHCSLSLSLAALLLQLVAMAVFLALRSRGNAKPYGQFYNVDAGQKVCLQRWKREQSGRPVQSLVLAPCQSQGHYTDNSQRFRLDLEGHLLSYSTGTPEEEELCADSELRLDRCRDNEETWVFTQGSGLVHVESAHCLTRDLGSQLGLSTCTNRSEQYWWYHLEGRSPPT